MCDIFDTKVGEKIELPTAEAKRIAIKPNCLERNTQHLRATAVKANDEFIALNLMVKVQHFVSSFLLLSRLELRNNDLATSRHPIRSKSLARCLILGVYNFIRNHNKSVPRKSPAI